MTTPQPNESTYQYTGALTPLVALTKVQKDMLLLCTKPRSLTYILTVMQYLHPQYDHAYMTVWRDIVKLRRYGLMCIHPPQSAPTLHLPTTQKHHDRRLAA